MRVQSRLAIVLANPSHGLFGTLRDLLSHDFFIAVAICSLNLLIQSLDPSLEHLYRLRYQLS